MKRFFTIIISFSLTLSSSVFVFAGDGTTAEESVVVSDESNTDESSDDLDLEYVDNSVDTDIDLSSEDLEDYGITLEDSEIFTDELDSDDSDFDNTDSDETDFDLDFGSEAETDTTDDSLSDAYTDVEIV